MNAPIPLSAPDIGEAEIAAVTAVLRRSQLSLGSELEAFERELAALHGVEDAVAVSSGTAGLHLALIAENIGPGDEVILPSFTFVAVANVVIQVGATPVFVEIDPVTLNIDPDSVEAAITPRTRAILVVHTFGVPAQMTLLTEIAHRFRLALIEDACEALGAEFSGRRVGTFGDAAVFGFYPNKQITTGEGGAVLVRSATRAARLRSLRNQGRSPGGDWLDHNTFGYNYRLPETACALGRVQLRRLSEILQLREEAAQRYNNLLRGVADVEPPPAALPGCKISWFVYVVRLAEHLDRDHIQAAMASEGVATGRYFPPIHLQPAWLGWRDAHASVDAAGSIHLPATESIGRRTLALPFFNRIQADQQERVVQSLSAAVRKT
jgi:perosamine synthetase